MKTTLIKIVLFTFIGSTVYATDSTHSKTDPKQQEMMKKWMAYSSPGAPHKALEPMVGEWTYTSKMWESTKAKPEESIGTSSMKMILGNRYLQQEFKGQAMGQPFEGRGLIGYNNLEKRYETTWADNMATGMMHGTGSYDARTKTFKDSGTFSCPMSEDKTREYRSEWKIMDKNNMRFTMWGPDMESGKEFKQMEIVYKKIR